MTAIKVGDLVKRMDVIGTGTGILYRVLKIKEEREHSVLQKTPRYNNHHNIVTRKVLLKPAVVMFESKLIAKRVSTYHFMCDLQKVDIVELGCEYVKLGNMISDEARARGLETAKLPVPSPDGDSAHQEP